MGKGRKLEAATCDGGAMREGSFGGAMLPFDVEDPGLCTVDDCAEKVGGFGIEARCAEFNDVNEGGVKLY